MTQRPEPVSDARLFELELIYDALAKSPSAGMPGRQISDAQHAQLFKELRQHRRRVCSTCEGRGWVDNPDARYDEDRGPHGESTGVYSTVDPEDIDCPDCGGVGYRKPQRSGPPPAFTPIPLDDETPF